MIPLFDLEVVSKTDPNYWPVREYVVWDANRCSEPLEKSMPAKSPKSAKIKSEITTTHTVDPIGTWRITEMEQWDKEYIDMEGPGLIAFEKKGQGEMLFGCVHVGLDWKYEKTADRIEFSFSGFEEGTEITGRGWAKVNGKNMDGKIFIHQGDESEFKAERKR